MAAPKLQVGATVALTLWVLLWLARWWQPRLPAAAVMGLSGAIMLGMAWLLLTAGRRQAALLAQLRQEADRREAAEAALRREHRMASIGRLTRGLAHDFNNHLTVVNSNVELLARRLPANAESLIPLAEAAIEGVRRAAALTHRLLSLSRKQPVEAEPLDLGRLVSGMAELLERALGKGIVVETALASGLWPAWADANQVEWCLLEMALNARDAMPQGGTLTIETANVAAGGDTGTWSAVMPGDSVMLAVSDTGGDAATPPWTGDPVSGGQLRVSRRMGQGGTARLFLPRYVIQPVPVAHSEPEAEAEGLATVLLVEDDEDVRSTTAAALRDMGYHVLEAPDAMEGFRLIADRGGIDLLFTDIGLPAGVDGRTLADAARNLVPELRVLFTTGQPPASGEGFAPDERGALFLAKPFSEAQLAAKLREALPARPAEPELEAGAV